MCVWVHDIELAASLATADSIATEKRNTKVESKYNSNGIKTLFFHLHADYNVRLYNRMVHLIIRWVR